MKQRARAKQIKRRMGWNAVLRRFARAVARRLMEKFVRQLDERFINLARKFA